MVDVLLWEWEWACCGEPFAVGDRVEFGVVAADDAVRELCAPAATPEFSETHHEREPDLRIAGVVRSVSALTVAHRMARVPRPTPPTPTTLLTSPDGAWAIEARPTPYVLTSQRCQGTARLEPLRGVGREVEDDDAPVAREPDPADGEVRRHLEGYLVALDED